MPFTKMIEIRDSGTTIAALAMLMFPCDPIEERFMRRCGFPLNGPMDECSVILMCLYNQKATNDPYSWADLGMGSRTMPVAHDYIIKNYGAISSGDVVDVQVILEERATPKTPEIWQGVADAAPPQAEKEPA